MTSMTTKKKTSVTRTQVLDYLADHPDFFASSTGKTQEVLFNLRIPHDRPENTISLLEYQNNLWRERAEMAESGQQTILSDLQYNVNVTKEMCRATLILSQSKDLTTLCAALEKIFKDNFKLPAYKLVFFSQSPSSPKTPPKSKLYSSWDINTLPKDLSAILHKQDIHTGDLPEIAQELFFGAAKKDLKSFACAPIYNSSKKRLLAAICLGSNSVERFSSDLLTDSISFLFDMIAINLEQCLAKSKK